MDTGIELHCPAQWQTILQHEEAVTGSTDMSHADMAPDPPLTSEEPPKKHLFQRDLIQNVLQIADLWANLAGFPWSSTCTDAFSKPVNSYNED